MTVAPRLAPMPRQSSSLVLTLAVVVLVGLLGWFLYTAEADAPEAAAPAATEPAAAAPAASLQAQRDLSAATPTTDRSPAAERTAVTAGAGLRFSLTGKLQHASGAPAPGVALELRQAPQDLPSGMRVPALGRSDAEPVARATTAADGSFRLDVPAGTAVDLHETAEDVYLAQAGTVRVAALHADRDLGVLTVGRAAKLSGVVRDPAGKPCAGVRVSVGHDGDLLLGVERANVAPTGADGAFARAGLRPGAYVLTTSSPDFTPARLAVELAEGEDRRDLVIELQPGKSIAGVVVDDTGKPLEGFKVAATRTRKLAPGTEVQTSRNDEATTTDAAGRFRLAGLEGTTVTVSAWGPGHARVAQQDVPLGTSELVLQLGRVGVVRGKLLDAAGKAIAGSNVRIQPAGETRGFAGILPGRRETETAADGSFTLDGVEPGAWRVVAEGAHRPAQSNALQLAPAQTIDGVQLVADRGATLLAKVRDAQGQPVADAEVVLRGALASPTPGMNVTRRAFRVGSGSGGAPVLLDDEEIARGKTDATGVARLAGLPAGRCVAQAKHERYAPVRSQPLEMPSAGEQQLELVLQPGGFLDVTVVDQNGAPVPTAPYRLTGPGDVKESGEADAQGRARVGPLTPGSWELHLALRPRPTRIGDSLSFVTAGGDEQPLAGTSQRVEVLADKTVAVRLVHPILATVRGTVSDASGRVAGAKVSLRELDSSRVAFGDPYATTTDASGAFELKDVPPAAYTLRFGHGDAVVRAEQSLTITPGDTLVERDLLLRTGTVKLIVRDQAGEPLPRARVALARAGEAGRSGERPRPAARMVMIAAVSTDSGGAAPETTQITAGDPSATSDADGEVVLEHVPEGTYQLSIEHPRHAEFRKPDVTVQQGATTDLGGINLEPGGELRGRVLSADGNPVEFAMVERVNADGSVHREPAMGGSFRMSGLSSGKYELRASAPQGNPGEPAANGPTVTVELGKGERKSVELRLR